MDSARSCSDGSQRGTEPEPCVLQEALGGGAASGHLCPYQKPYSGTLRTFCVLEWGILDEVLIKEPNRYCSLLHFGITWTHACKRQRVTCNLQHKPTLAWLETKSFDTWLAVIAVLGQFKPFGSPREKEEAWKVAHWCLTLKDGDGWSCCDTAGW